MYVNIHSHNFERIRDLTVYNVDISQPELLEKLRVAPFSVGIHPWFFDGNAQKAIVKLTQIIENQNIVAIGECGFDKNLTATYEVQQEIFLAQVELSESLKKPLIIHCVGYFNQLLQLKKTLNPAQMWIIHGFRGKPQLAEQLLNAGIRVSFCPKFNAESVRITPFDSLFVETDDYATPVHAIYRQIALIKNCRQKELAAGEMFWKKANI